MTKKELIKAISQRTSFTQKDVADVVDATFATIIDTVATGEELAIAGFGKFDITERAARTGINPQTGAKIDIPATKSPKFRAGKAFKDACK